MFYLIAGWVVLAAFYVAGRIGDHLKRKARARRLRLRRAARWEDNDIAAAYLHECAANRQAIRDWEAMQAVEEAERIVGAGR